MTTYTAPGVYTVSLTVTDASGRANSSTTQIFVYTEPVTPVPDQPPAPSAEKAVPKRERLFRER